MPLALATTKPRLLHAEDGSAHMSLQLLNDAVMRGPTTGFMQNPNKPAIQRLIEIWKKQILERLFGR